MAYYRRSYESTATAVEQVQRDELAMLVERYEAIRSISGRDRDAAMEDLEYALQRYGQPFVCGGWIYRWCREENSITRLRYTRIHLHGKE